MFFPCFHRVTETPRRELGRTRKGLETLRHLGPRVPTASPLPLTLLEANVLLFAARQPPLVNSVKLAVYRPFMYKFNLKI